MIAIKVLFYFIISNTVDSSGVPKIFQWGGGAE